MLLLARESVKHLICGRNSKYNNCVFGCTVSTSSVIWAEHSGQCMWCGLDSEYCNIVLDYAVSTATVFWLGK